MANSSGSTSQVVLCPNQDKLKEILQENTNRLVVLEFAASWCGYCQLMEPAVEEMARTYSNVVVFVKIDWDEMRDVTRDYGVRGFPTFILLKKGKKLAKVLGAKKDELKKQIEKHKG
uniref:Thioredoxin n=1 Tax=Davidia involucrata TaxID=16924 RepID=A0A5B7AU86_DAVIN